MKIKVVSQNEDTALLSEDLHTKKSGQFLSFNVMYVNH